MSCHEEMATTYVKAFNIPETKHTCFYNAGNIPISIRLIPCMQPVMIAIIRMETTTCALKTKINIKEQISPNIHIIADVFTSFFTDLYK